MKNTWKWILVFVAVLLAAFLIALPILGRVFLGAGLRVGGYPMLSRLPAWHMFSGGHMFGLTMFGSGLWMLGRFLFPLALIALVVLTVLALLRKPGSTETVAATSIPCPHCGKHILENWLACPYCGEKAR